MRRIITFSLFLLSVLVVCGATKCDSIKVYFALNTATFNPALDDNAASVEKFIDGLIVAASSGTLDSISVYGYASPEGFFYRNYRLSARRCNAFAKYVSQRTGIPMKVIHTHSGGVAWDALRTLVVKSVDTPNRDKVLQVLDKYVPRACTNANLSDQCAQSLIDIDKGRTYQWMLKNLFPKLRFSLAVYIYTSPDSSADSANNPSANAIGSTDESTVAQVHEEIDFNAPLTFPGYTVDNITTPSSFESFVPAHIPVHRLAVKTNLLYYAALMPNLEVEWRVNRDWSVALEGDVAWWGSYAKLKSYRLAMVSPEVRRWFFTRAPWHGLYVGAFAGGGLYDFQNGGPGYSGEGAMGGLSIGYMWPISRCLSLEAGIGAGYLYTRYKEYKSLDGHHVYQRTKDLNYFGPLKVKFSLVWRLWDQNKPRRLNDKNETEVQYER